MTTFPCPHCQRRFPFQDSLVDRPLRCSCGGAFIVGRDAIARPVGAPSATADEPTPDARSTPAPRATAAHRHRQDELRRRLGSSLRVAAERITEDSAPPPASTAADRPTDTGRVFRPVRTAHASREHRDRRRWSATIGLGFAGIVAIVAGWWWASRPDAPAQALQAFAAEPPSGLPADLRLEAVRERAWLNTVDGRQRLPVLTRLDDAHIQAPRRLEGEPLRQVRALLAEHANHRRLCILAPARDEAGSSATTDTWLSPADRRAYLAAHQAAIPYEVIPERLRACGLDPLAQRAIALLIAGTAADGTEPLDLVRDPTVTAIELAAFHGEDASLLRPGPGGLRAEAGQRYRGLLMRPHRGPEALTPWRVLEVQVLDPEVPRSEAEDPQAPLLSRVDSLERILELRAEAVALLSADRRQPDDASLVRSNQDPVGHAEE